VRQVALCLLVVTCGLPLPAPLDGQALSRSQLLSAARDVMSAAPYVAFATVDEEGRPAVRAMDALAPDEGLVVWFATNPRSRKVDQLRADPRVALHYLDTDGPGYVTLNGVARLVEDPALKAGHWKES
jgi:general stress protein 26